MIHDARDRYLQDPQFKQLVDMMTAHILQANYTPSEMRAAAVLASIKYEEIQFRPRSMVVYEDDHKVLIDINKSMEEIRSRYK